MAQLMKDTDPEFDNNMRLLSEAGRINPAWGATLWAAQTPDELDAKVEEARAIVDEESEQAWV